MASRFQNSEEFLSRALKVIPLGSQTFSKSVTQFPYGVSPYFITRAEGSRVWDIDGNEYIDFISSLGAITLGYSDPDVNSAVQRQLADGVIFSLAHPVETLVAEKFRSMVPAADLIRYGKNGSDATAAAVRLARAYTKRDRVAVCGYHGWQDWYIGSTSRNLGVPQAVRDLTHPFVYNDLESLSFLFRKHPEEFAAVILEPMHSVAPIVGYHAALKELAHSHGALLIFDETVTGFRFANGGAQELFGVTPDLSTFGKGMANGFPISLVTGRGDVMRLMEDIFFSFTFGGETLSLAAAFATMEKFQRLPVVDTLRNQGNKILKGVAALIELHGIQGMMAISGNPVMPYLAFKDFGGQSQWKIKTLYLQEIMSRGILSLGGHIVTYAHSNADIERLLAVYSEVFPLLKEAVTKGGIDTLLRCKPLVPLFKVR